MKEFEKLLVTLADNNSFLIKQIEKNSESLNNILEIITYQRVKKSKKGQFYIGKKLRWKILQRDNYRCQNCGFTKHYDSMKVLSTSDLSYLHIDHIDPKVLGGGNEEENLQTLCSTCNLYKRSYVFKEEICKTSSQTQPEVNK